jgi:type IV secretion system protein VirB4
MVEKRFAPLVGPWTQNTGITDKGGLYATFRVSGISADLAAGSQIDQAHAIFNDICIRFGKRDYEWWGHFTRVRQARMTPLPECSGWFASRFDQAYTECLGKNLFQNDLWFTVFRRADAGLKSGLKGLFRASRAAMRSRNPLSRYPVPYAERMFLDDFQDTVERIHGALNSNFGCRRLGLEKRHGVWFSEIDEAYHIIMNNFARQIPVSRGRSSYNILPYATDFGDRALSLSRGATSHVFASMLGMLNYPTEAPATMMDAMRAVPFGLTITNSYAFRRQSVSISDLTKKVRMMTSGNDLAEEDLRGVVDTRKHVAANRQVMGKHHLSVAVFSHESLEDLDRKAIDAETTLSNAGLNVTREDEGLKPAYYAQLPGNARWRTRPIPMTSTVFCSMAAMHNVPRGQFEGRWGAPIINLRTTQDTEYPFHFHVQGSAQIPAEDLGSCLMIGPSASGKTTALGALALLSERQGARVVIVDKDFGLAPLIHACGGSHAVLGDGEPCLAPLRALPNTPDAVNYLTKLIRMLIMWDNQGELSSQEEERLPRAVALQMQLPPKMREMAGIAAMLGQSEGAGARARLRKWCRGERLGWALDGLQDGLDTSKRMVGYDTTALLKNEEVCSPILSYIFYRTRQLINGQPIVLLADEFWNLDRNPAFAEDNNDQLKTIRKNEGVVILGTQSARDVLNSANSHTYRQQIPTKIFAADASASREDLIDGLGLTETEFLWVRERLSATGRHQFLVKRPSESFIARFDLSRRPDMVAVVSGRRSTYELMLDLKRKHGDEPEKWVPHYQRLAPLVAKNPRQRLEEAEAA